MDDKILTISIAAYNVKEYIENTLMSLVVPPEYMEKMDIIVVDDGATDGTAEIAAFFEKKYPGSIRVIRKRNGGYGSTVNMSIQEAKGRYFRLLDGDDWYEKDALPQYIDYLCSIDSDMVLTPYYEIIGNMRRLVVNHPEISESTINIEKMRPESLHMHGLAIKSEILRRENVVLDEKCLYTDNEYVLACVCGAKTVSRINLPIYCYRLGLNGQSVSTDSLKKHYKDLIMVSRHNMDYYRNKVRTVIADQCICDIIHNVFRTFLLIDQDGKMKKELIEYDAMVKKQFPEYYDLGNNSKTVKRVRSLNYMMFSLVSAIVKRRD